MTRKQTCRALPSLTRLGFAGASIPDGVLQKLTQRFPGVTTINHYGSSEIYTYTVTQNAAGNPGSAGVAGINATIAVIPLGTDDVTNQVLAGTEGQVIASTRSDEAFSGYLNRPDADAAAFKDGWYFTGDVGYVDAQGELFLTGRVDDMIITGGENVMPIEIESVLSLHPDVKEAIVVGRPDERWDKRLQPALFLTKRYVPRISIAIAEHQDCRGTGAPKPMNS